MLNRWEPSSAPQPPLRGLFNAPGRAAILADATAWAGDQPRATALLRGALWLFLLLSGLRLVMRPDAGDIFGFFTFVIHEGGHALFGVLGMFLGPAIGMFLSVAGGSITQLLAPLWVLFTFWRQRDYFALSAGGYWLASSLFNLSAYIGDARAQQIELISPFSFGDKPIHDWNWLLTQMHLLPFDHVFSWMVRLLATVIFGVSMAWGGRMLWAIWQRK